MIPFLLIPGLNCTGRVFEGVAQCLWPHGPVVLANHTGGESMAEIAASILETAPPQFALLGFSMGGYIAFEIMRQAPGRVTRLALIDTIARADDSAARDRRQKAIGIVARGGFSRVLSDQFPRTVDASNTQDAAIQRLHRAMAEELGPDTYIRHQKAIAARPDSRPGLENVKVPTCVIVGENDEVTPVGDAREMAASISGSVLTIVPGAGHFALIEQPEIVHKALTDWAVA